MVGLRLACQTLIEGRLDPVPPDLEAVLAAIDDLDVLESLLKEIASAPDAESVRAIFDRRGSP